MLSRPRIIIVATIALMAAVAPLSSASAADVSGKTIALAHVNQFQDDYEVNATIAKGKKNHVLVIHSEANILLSTALSYCLDSTLSVNGFVLLAEPTPAQGAACTDCAGSSCTVHGTYFLDLDAAELANPGSFYGVPVTVHHSGSPYGGNAAGNAMLTVTMHKK